MISLVRDTVETLIRKLQSDVTPNTVLVPLNDYYEIKQVPSLLVIGPKLEENRAKRVSEKIVEIDQDSLSYTQRNWPRFYHLDFDFMLTASNGMDLLDLQEKLIVFFLDNHFIQVSVAPGFGIGGFGVDPWGASEDDAEFYLSEMIPIGGLERPNYSNLRQASGRYRIEDVPVFDNDIEEGKLVLYRDFVLCDFGTRARVETFSR